MFFVAYKLRGRSGLGAKHRGTNEGNRYHLRGNRSLTFDNGKEFARFRDIEEALGLKVYFAKPYHSWERGTNENRNGIVRKVWPKGSALDNLTDEDRARIDYLLNDRPMRCLGWRTPREAFLRLLSRSPPRSAARRPPVAPARFASCGFSG